MDTTGLKKGTTGSGVNNAERPLTPSERIMRENEAQWELYKLGKKHGIQIWLRNNFRKENSNDT